MYSGDPARRAGRHSRSNASFGIAAVLSGHQTLRAQRLGPGVVRVLRDAHLLSASHYSLSRMNSDAVGTAASAGPLSPPYNLSGPSLTFCAPASSALPLLRVELETQFLGPDPGIPSLAPSPAHRRALRLWHATWSLLLGRRCSHKFWVGARVSFGQLPQRPTFQRSSKTAPRISPASPG